MDHSVQLTEHWEQVCGMIWNSSVTQLYLGMPYFDLAFSSLKLYLTTELEHASTDGVYFCIHPKYMADLYLENALLVNRLYLHTILHLILRHPFKRMPASQREDAGLLWDLACDIVVESIIDGMHHRCIRTGISRLRKDWYETLHRDTKVLTAETVFRSLQKRQISPYVLSLLIETFMPDEHVLWPSKKGEEGQPPSVMQIQKHWEEIADKSQTKMETFSREEASGSGQLREELKAEYTERYSYRDFLKRFTVWKEELKADPDTFDYVFYTYGLSLYGNMPLVEPLESREVQRIEEFVIVLDVSMSTSGKLVQTFLDQTYAVLSEQETYLRKFHIRILQCDDQVREDQRITNAREMEEYRNHFHLKGGGGTDFRPAFAYVRELLLRKELTNLKGMIYFTDGYGIYPLQKPPWETAFIFMEEDYSDKAVPPWALKLVVGDTDLAADGQPDGGLRTDYHFLT